MHLVPNSSITYKSREKRKRAIKAAPSQAGVTLARRDRNVSGTTFSRRYPPIMRGNVL